MNYKKTVLVVEDSRVQAEFLRYLLECNGYHVLHASDGQEGVVMAKIHLPDYIVMDVIMPRMDGFEACRQIKANYTTSTIPVIMLTSRDNHDDVRRGLSLGVHAYIPKDALSEDVLLDTLAFLTKEQTPWQTGR